MSPRVCQSFTAAVFAIALLAGQNVAVASPPTTAANVQRTQQVARRFIDAYNAHNLHSILALTTPHVHYVDCDYSRHQTRHIFGRMALKRWLSAQFARQDHLEVTSVLAGGWSNDVYDPRVFGLMGTRSNRTISAHGLPPQSIDGSKGVLNRAGTRIAYYLLSDCS